MNPFTPAGAKLTIASLEPEAYDLVVEAQFNPNDLQLDKPVPWMEHPELCLEYGGRKPRTFSVELLFDGHEACDSIQPQLDALDRLSSPRDGSSRRESMRRPHDCIVLWGAAGMPRLRCVIEQLTTKYVMWDRAGKPVRAIATVKLKETRLDREELAREARL